MMPIKVTTLRNELPREDSENTEKIQSRTNLNLKKKVPALQDKCHICARALNISFWARLGVFFFWKFESANGLFAWICSEHVRSKCEINILGNVHDEKRWKSQLERHSRRSRKMIREILVLLLGTVNCFHISVAYLTHLFGLGSQVIR